MPISDTGGLGSHSTKMFLVRAVASFTVGANLIDLAACGRTKPFEFGDKCFSEPWHNFNSGWNYNWNSSGSSETSSTSSGSNQPNSSPNSSPVSLLRPFRMLHVFAAVVRFLNGISLIFHYNYPNSPFPRFPNRGNKQLFVRGLIRSMNTPLQLTYCVLKVNLLTGTKYERNPIEWKIHLIRALVFNPFIFGSLFAQWYTSESHIDDHSEVHNDAHNNAHNNAKCSDSEQVSDASDSHDE
jgi:hypothetical protein